MVFLAIFYTVGIIGLHSTATSDLFRQLTPFNILLSVVVLFCFHRWWSPGAVISLIVIACAGFVIEMFGVQSGKVFGVYEYGQSLGWKAWNTPLIIGINWLLLVYITHLTVKQIGIGKPWIELTAAALMTALDYLIEPVAVQYDFWHWKNEVIPVQNFVAWFYISFIMQLFLNRTKPVAENKMAIPLLILQIVFFTVLNIWK